MRQKIDLYRRLARAGTAQDLQAIASELRDRFGPLPQPVARLLTLAQIRIDAQRWLIESIRTENQYAVFRYASGSLIRQLASAHGGRLRIVDDQSAYVDLGQQLAHQDLILEAIKLLLQPSQADHYNPASS